MKRFNFIDIRNANSNKYYIRSFNSPKMNLGILKHLSHLTDQMIVINEDFDMAKESVENYFNEYYDEKTLKESNEMLERYQKMTKNDKDGLNSDLKKLDLLDIFDFKEFQINVKQANNNCSHLNELNAFFDIFKDNKIQSILPLGDDDDIESPDPDLSTLIQQFNFYQETNFPVVFFLNDKMLLSLQKVIEKNNLERLKSIGDNIFKQYILKEFIFENPDIKLSQLIEYINNDYDQKCEEEFMDSNFQKMTLSTFKTEIYEPYISNNPAINAYNYEDIGKNMDSLYLKVNPKTEFNSQFTLIVRLIVIIPFMDKIAESYHLFMENKSLFEKCPFFSFKMLENPKDNLIKLYVESGQNYDSICLKKISELKNEKFKNFAYAIQPKLSLMSKYFSFIELLFLIILSYKDSMMNIYDIVVTFLNDDQIYSSLKSQTNNSCVFGEKKEALYQLIFILDWLKSGNNDFNQKFDSFVNSHCSYLDTSQNEVDVNSSIQLIMNNRQFFKEMIEGKTPVASLEYNYVMSVKNGKYVFAVDSNQVTLDPSDSEGPVVEYVKLKLIASSLNITMFESRGDFKFQEAAMKFVSRFQLCEKLKTELKLLSNYYDDRSQAKFTFKLDDNENEEEEENDDVFDEEQLYLPLKAQIARIVNAKLSIESTINKFYTGPMTFFTKENICLSFSYVIKKDKENLKNIIFSTINKISIKKDDFIDSKIDEICKKISFKKGSYDEKFQIYLGYFSNFINDCLSEEIYKTPKILSDQEKGSSIASCKRRIMEKAVTILLYTSYQYLPDLIFYLFYSFQNEMPSYNQMLVCTKDTTINRVISFLKFYRSSNQPQNAGKASSAFKLFLLINPQNLEGEVSTYLINHITKYSSELLGNSRLVLLSTKQTSQFIDIYRVWNIDNISSCKFEENKKYKSIISNSKTKSFMIYTDKPRTGKSHLIMKTIYDNYKKNLYHRIIVDSTTTLTQLISLLREAPLIDGCTICYHFNIEGSDNEQITLYIIMLYLFGSLNDGVSEPFVLSNKNETIFFFEFGARPPMNQQKFIENIFPIGKYMDKLQIPSDKEFFSLDEYCVSLDEYSKITCKQLNRSSLYETSALIDLRNKYYSNKQNRFFYKLTSDQLCKERDQLIKISKSDPKHVYDNLLSLFKQDWIPKEVKDIHPLISQLDDVSHVIVNLIDFIFSTATAEQESGLEANKGKCPIRFMSLSLVFETAIINCGLPYLYPQKSDIEIDKFRLDRITNWIDNAERILIITGLNTRLQTGCGVRTIQHSQRVLHKKSIDEEFEIKLQDTQILEGLIYSPEKWKRLEKDNTKIFQELEAIFSLKFVGFTSTFTLCVFCWNNLTNEEKAELKQITNKEKEYFKKLKEITNCNIRKHPQFYPKNPSPNCRLFIDLLSSIFRKQRMHSSIKNEQITTHEKAVDVIQQYVLSNSLLMTYSYTLHNIEMFLHIIYRIYSNLPIVMMGETGSGKTYSVDFLKEVIGPQTMLLKRCFDGGTEERDIKQYVNENIKAFKSFHTDEELENNQCQIIFFFDEVNTAPCQWFIKDLVIDRFLDGKKIPDYVKFICAMNPKRLLPDCVKQRLRGLEQKHQSELSNLVYKVRQIPESFVPYIFSADAPRTLPKGIENVSNYDDLSEFEKVCEKVIDQKLDVEPLPLYKKLSTGKMIHFSASSSYSVCFDFKFFSQSSDSTMKMIFKDDTSIRTQKVHSFISRLNAYAGRLFINKKDGIYKDNSFMSIRESERCANLMRWFYKKGIYEFSTSKNWSSKLTSSQLFRKSFMLAFSVTYWLRLSDYKLENQKICDRDSFINKIIKKWEELIVTPEFNFLFPILQPPTFDEWINQTIKHEQQKYADLFVSDDEGLSKNDALCENIWATYVSLSNNIPLWIIGRPGTSKSLAVNIVLAKLFTGRTISNMPTLVYQTFMCSSDSRSEALISQMSRIAEKSLLLPTKGSITALLLEEIGHADLSPYLPLKCLNHIIDDGFEIVNNGESEFLPITLIGLSNYKMDSAKLNRGILIIRDELSPEQKKKTALDIFSSTALSLFKANNNLSNNVDEFIKRYQGKIESLTDCYHNSSKSIQFMGLRDFYGVIKLITSVLYDEGENNLNRIIYAIKRNFSGDKTSSELFNYSVRVFDTKQTKLKADPSSLDLIRDNLKEDWSKLKNPLSRHMLLVTEGNSALNLLISELQIKDRLIYADNFSGLPDDEWISNDLKQFAKSMTSGETIIFIGNHPCFNCLYDVFNLRYETIYGDSFALISFAGDSFLVKVHPKFKVIIIMEENEYKSLPAPFLNRFEKMFLNYNLILSQNKKDFSENYENYIRGLFPDFKVNVSFPSLKKAPEYYFGCYNQHHFRAITYFNDQMKLNKEEMDQLVFLNCQPSKAVVALTKYKHKQIQILSDILNETSSLKTSILHLLYFYNKSNASKSSLTVKLYDYWKDDSNKIPGIQAMLLLPFAQEIKNEYFQPFGELIHIQLSEKINEGLILEKIKKSQKRVQNKLKATIMLVDVQNYGENLQQRIFHLQAVFESIRKNLSKIDGYSLHTLITIDMTVWKNNLSFVQSVDWPVIFLDTCISSNLKPLESSLKTIDLSSMIFTPLSKIFPKTTETETETKNKIDLIDLDSFIDIVKNDLLLIYTKEKRDLLSASLSNKTISSFMIDYLLTIINQVDCFNISFESSETIAEKKKKKKKNQDDDEEEEDEDEEADDEDEDQDENPWFLTFLNSLYNSPPSLIEYLSVKLSRVVENIYALITQTILSCADDFKPDLEKKGNLDVINFIFNTYLFTLKLENSIMIETPQMYPIEYRYLNPNKVPMWQMFKYMWEIVIYDPGMILNPDDDEEEEEEEWKEEEEDEAEKELTPEIIEKFFKDQFQSESLIKTYITPKVIPDSFYAAYILLICPGIVVNSIERDREKFTNLINCIKKIILNIYGKKLSLAKTMLILLDQTLKSYLITICQSYLFIPQSDQIKYIKYKNDENEENNEEIVLCIQNNIASVANQIILNVFSHKFRNIIELKNFFSFAYPLIRSLSLEFGYILDKENWDLQLMNSYLNILNIYNSLFLMLPQNVTLTTSMWRNQSLKFDINNLPKSATDIIKLVDVVLNSIKKSSKIDDKDIKKIYKYIVSDYSVYMSIDVFHGFCDPELEL